MFSQRSVDKDKGDAITRSPSKNGIAKGVTLIMMQNIMQLLIGCELAHNNFMTVTQILCKNCCEDVLTLKGKSQTQVLQNELCWKRRKL